MVNYRILCEEIENQIKKVLGTENWIMVNYGSRHVLYDEKSDFDCCIYSRYLTYDQQLEIADAIREIHLKYNLKIDNDMKYINKTSFCLEDIELLKGFPPFPSVDGRLVLTDVTMERIFLDSHDMKMRLLLNIFTKNCKLVYGSIDLFQSVVNEMYDILLSILLKTTTDGLAIDEMVNMMFVRQGMSSYKGYLGYNIEDNELRDYVDCMLHKTVKRAYDNNKIEKKDNKFYLLHDEGVHKKEKIIYVMGASGTGTSSLGKLIKENFDVNLIESDELTMYITDPPFKFPRPQDVRIKLLESKMNKSKVNVIVGSINEWGNAVIERADILIFLYESTEIREERIKEREEKRFGKKLIENNDVANNYSNFIKWTKMYDSFDEPRSLKKHRNIYDSFHGTRFFFGNSESTEEIFSAIKSDIVMLEGC